jgi:hypothetical protein
MLRSTQTYKLYSYNKIALVYFVKKLKFCGRKFEFCLSFIQVVHNVTTTH